MSTTQQQLHGSPSASSSIQIPSQNGMRTVTITDMSQSVGGTLYGTTPGGTRIKYDRSMLLRLSSSPVSRTPPKGLPVIPGVTKASCNDSKPQVPAQASVDETDGEDDGTTGGSSRLAAQQQQHQPQPQQSKHDDDDEHMFDME